MISASALKPQCKMDNDDGLGDIDLLLNNSGITFQTGIEGNGYLK